MMFSIEKWEGKGRVLVVRDEKQKKLKAWTQLGNETAEQLKERYKETGSFVKGISTTKMVNVTMYKMPVDTFKKTSYKLRKSQYNYYVTAKITTSILYKGNSLRKGRILSAKSFPSESKRDIDLLRKAALENLYEIMSAELVDKTDADIIKDNFLDNFRIIDEGIVVYK